jgi:CysZ protein
LLEEAIFQPISRAASQLGDRVFVGVLWRSVAWSTVCFALLHVAVIAILHRLLAWHGWLAWAADILGTVGAILLTVWLFLQVAAAIGTIYIERIAAAVERRYYPGLPAPKGAPLTEQIWDGIAVAIRVLGFNVIALVLALVIPGIGLILGWMIAAYAIGRGLFVAVAMRRMSRYDAEGLYARHRVIVLIQGAIISAMGFIPLFNLLFPMLGTAVMVHALDIILIREWRAPPGVRLNQ